MKDAIENSNGNVGNVLQNLGLATCEFGDNGLLSEIQWRVLDVTDFDDINECELVFEETSPLKHANIIDRLVCDEDIFDDKIIRVVEYDDYILKLIPELANSLPDNLELNCLTNREREVLQMYKGIGCSAMTMEEISKEFTITPERVRQILEKAIRRLSNAKSMNCFAGRKYIKETLK